MTTPKHVSGTIKALEWTEWDTDCWFSSLNGFTIAPSSSVNHEGEYRLACDRANFRYFTTIDAAKAAAQADYEARILAAIQPSQEPKPVYPADVQKIIDYWVGELPRVYSFPAPLLAERIKQTIAVVKHAAIQPDPEPQPVAWENWAENRPDQRHLSRNCPETENGELGRPLYATPSSAGTVSVEAAARVLLDACPNPIFDQLKPVLMGEVTERVGYTDEDGNEDYYDRPVSWDAMKEIIRAALRALAREGER